MSIYHLRTLTFADKSIWLEMWQEYLNFYQTAYDANIAQHSFDKLLTGGEAIGCLLACNEQNEAVGFVTYTVHFSTWQINPSCYLIDLYVKKEHRRAKIASAFLNKMEEIGKERGWSKVYWITKPNNEAAKKLYDNFAEGNLWVRYQMPIK